MTDSLNEKTNTNLSDEEIKDVSGGEKLGQNGSDHPAEGYCRCNQKGPWGRICPKCRSAYADYRAGAKFNFF